MGMGIIRPEMEQSTIYPERMPKMHAPAER